MNIGLGTAAIGRPQYINIKESQTTTPFDIDTFIAKGKMILSNAYDKGIRHFDTAPGYGIAERILIEWIEENQPKDLTISTKWGYTYVANFDPKADVHEVKELSLKNLNKQWQYSSKLLPHLSIYQIHSATLESGILENKEVLHRLLELKKEHNIAIGLSTSGANQNEVIQKALNISINGDSLFDSFQVTYNVFDQTLATIQDVLEGKQIIIKEALANGRVFPNENYPHYKGLHTVLSTLAKKHNVGIDAIALRFCIDTINPFKVLSGATETLHLTANLQALSIHLSEEDIGKIKAFAINPEDYWLERKELDWN